MPLQPASAALVADGGEEPEHIVVARRIGQLRRVEAAVSVPAVSGAIDRWQMASQSVPHTSIATLDLAKEGLTVGAYDPERAFSPDDVGIQHWYTRQDDPAELEAASQHAANRHTVNAMNAMDQVLRFD
jgi:hypothetical protein